MVFVEPYTYQLPVISMLKVTQLNEALFFKERQYTSIKHWLIDNHPEVFEAYIEAFYTITDNSSEEKPDDAEYTGCEGYPRYDG